MEQIWSKMGSMLTGKIFLMIEKIWEVHTEVRPRKVVTLLCQSYFDFGLLFGKWKMEQGYPWRLIFSSLWMSRMRILRPSMAITFSPAKVDRVRMALEEVMFDKLAMSSRDR